MKLDLNLCSCLYCGAVFNERIIPKIRLYKLEGGYEHDGEAIKCPVCQKHTVLWRDWGIDRDYLGEKLGDYREVDEG